MSIFAMIFPIIIGYLVLCLILREKQNIISLPEKLAIAFMFGSSLITLQMFIYSLCGIKFSVLPIALPWIVLLPALLYMKEQPKLEFKPFSQIESLLAILISLKVIYIFFEALIKPVVGFDSLWNFSLRSKIFFFEKAIPLIKSSLYFMGGGMKQYPLQIPLFETWTYLAMNSWNDVQMKIMFPIYFVCLIVLFYSSLIKEKSRVQALFFTFLLSTLPLLTYHATIEYADFVLGTYTFGAVIFLYRYLQVKENKLLIISALLIGFSGWVKDEGIVFYIICMIVFFAYNKFKEWKPAIIFIFPFALITIPWLLAKNVLGLTLGNSQDFSLSIKYFTFHPEVIPKILEKTFLTDNNHLLPIAFIILVIFYSRDIFKTNKKYIFSIFMLIFVFFLFLYTCTYNWDMIFSDIILSRNYLTYLPIALYLIGQTFSPAPRE